MITYHGIDLSPYINVYEITGRGFLPPLRTMRREVSGKIGSHPSKVELEPRIIRNKFTILTDNKAELLELSNELAEILLKEDEGPITYHDAPHLTYMGKLIGASDLEDLSEIFSRGQITFECSDPRSYADEKQYTIDSFTRQISNNGQTRTSMKFTATFNKSVSGFMISNGKGQFVKINYNFSNLDKLTIDFETRKILLNDNINMPLLDMRSRWFDLEKGVNNISVSSLDAVMNIVFKERFY